MNVQELLAKLLAEVGHAWRFRWYGVAAAWAICLGGWGWASLLPDIYEANTWVYVDTSSVLRPILNNRIVSADVTTQLRYVRTALYGQDNLLRVLRETGVDVDSVPDPVRDNMVLELSGSLEMLTNDGVTYQIKYRNHDRDRAVAVVETLLTAFVDDTLGANQAGTQVAEQFVDARIAEYEQRLSAAELALAEFKRRNADRLPGAEGGYFERMRVERAALEEAERSLALARSRVERLQTQLTASDGADSQIATSIDAQIQDYRMQLERLKLQYTDRHPDVINLQDALKRLEDQRAAQFRGLTAGNGSEQASRVLDANPIYQALRIGLNEAEVEVAALQADVRERTGRLRELQNLIDEVPQVEADLARLNRDYEIVYEQYQSMVRSRETQDLSRKAADTDQIEFHILGPPSAGYAPVAPNRVRLFAAILIGALGVGGALCWLLAQLRPVFGDIGTLREVSGLPVLGAVSRVWERRRHLQWKLEVAGFASMVAMLLLVFGVGVALELYGPGVAAALRLS